MSDVAWTGTPVRPHADARDNGAEALPWGGRRERLPLKWPFAEAVDGYRRKALANDDYDPASTFVWGQMMAVGLIEALKAVAPRGTTCSAQHSLGSATGSSTRWSTASSRRPTQHRPRWRA
jgi:hypothetical protein